MQARSYHASVGRIDVFHGASQLGWGTAFVVGPRELLTASHVLRGANGDIATRITWTRGGADGVGKSPVDVHLAADCEDTTLDWALLELAPSAPSFTDIAPLVLSERVVEHRSPFVSFGYATLNPHEGIQISGHVELANGHVQGSRAMQLYGAQAAAPNAFLQGHSGAPVVVDGSVVGIVRSIPARHGAAAGATIFACSVLELLGHPSVRARVRTNPCDIAPSHSASSELPDKPFRYLEPYGRDDSALYFGRCRELIELLSTLRDTHRVTLLFGASGVGKSSFLEAGIAARFAADFDVRSERCSSSRSPLEALARGLQIDVAATTDAFETAWRELDAQSTKPRLLIVDQLEGAWASAGGSEGVVAPSLDPLLLRLNAHFARGAPRSITRLVLAFRKEWLPEIEACFARWDIPTHRVHLDALDGERVMEVVLSIPRTPLLHAKYELEIDEKAASSIAADLTADRRSPIAPVLQVLMTNLWTSVEKEAAPRRIDDALYQRVKESGTTMDSFVRQQLATIAPANVASGFALDVLRFFTSELGTAEQRSAAELGERYHDKVWLAAEVVLDLEKAHLLVRRGDEGNATGIHRLVHDTLAPVVRSRYAASMARGPRAARVLDARAASAGGIEIAEPLGDADLTLLEDGLSAMRSLTDLERKFVARSRARRLRARVFRASIVIASVVALVASLFVRGMLRDRSLDRHLRDATSALLVEGREPDAIAASLRAAAISEDSRLVGEILRESVLAAERARDIGYVTTTGVATWADAHGSTIVSATHREVTLWTVSPFASQRRSSARLPQGRVVEAQTFARGTRLAIRTSSRSHGSHAVFFDLTLRGLGQISLPTADAQLATARNAATAALCGRAEDGGRVVVADFVGAPGSPASVSAVPYPLARTDGFATRSYCSLSADGHHLAFPARDTFHGALGERREIGTPFETRELLTMELATMAFDDAGRWAVGCGQAVVRTDLERSGGADDVLSPLYDASCAPVDAWCKALVVSGSRRAVFTSSVDRIVRGYSFDGWRASGNGAGDSCERDFCASRACGRPARLEWHASSDVTAFVLSEGGSVLGIGDDTGKVVFLDAHTFSELSRFTLRRVNEGGAVSTIQLDTTGAHAIVRWDGGAQRAIRVGVSPHLGLRDANEWIAAACALRGPSAPEEPEVRELCASVRPAECRAAAWQSREACCTSPLTFDESARRCVLPWVVSRTAPNEPSGCADGEREAFVGDEFRDVAGCAASLEAGSLMSPRSGRACGDDVEPSPCASAADACADGWEVCGAGVGGGHELTERLTLAQCCGTRTAGGDNSCNTSFATGVFIGAWQDVNCNACGVAGGNGAICCGSGCLLNDVSECAWDGGTPVSRPVSRNGGFMTRACGEMFLDGRRGDEGVLCCRRK